MQADYQSTKFRGLGPSCDFSKLPLEEETRSGAPVQGFALLGSWTSVTDASLKFATASAKAKNPDRVFTRPPAFGSQFDQLAARLFRGFVFHGVKNLRVSYQSPQSVTADQENVLRAQRLRLPG